jgi:hypothetical protein
MVVSKVNTEETNRFIWKCSKSKTRKKTEKTNLEPTEELDEAGRCE